MRLSQRNAATIALSIGLALVAPTIAIAEDLTLDQVLDRWAEALGGRDALQRQEQLHQRSSVEMMGMNGTLEQWSTAAGRLRFELELAGIFKVTQGYDGRTAWQVDQNDKLSELGGSELASMVNNAYMLTFSYLLDDRRPGTREYQGVDAVTGEHVVTVVPEGGQASTFYLDPETFLPVRSERVDGDRGSTTAYSDWKKFGDVMEATTLVQTSGGHQEMTFRLQESAAVNDLAASMFAVPQDQADDVGFAEGLTRVRVPMELNTVHIFLQAEVNGEGPFWFLLDTGASVTVLNMPLVEDLGLETSGKMEGRGAGEGSVDVTFVQGVSLEIPGIQLSEQTLAVIDFTPIETRIGRTIDGVLGFDFISRFVVEIDYDDGEIVLHDRAAFRYEGSGSRVPITLDGSVPIVEAAAKPFGREALAGSFLIDTGAAASVGFTRPFTHDNGLLSTLSHKIEYVGGGGVGGQSRMWIGRIENFQLGDFKLENMISAFSEDKSGAGGRSDRAGLIGGDILHHFTVFFDYDGGVMILEPNANFGEAFDPDLSGLVPTTGGRGAFNHFRIHSIVDGTPADEAGLQQNDVLVAVAGRAAESYTMHTLYERLNEPGEITVRYRRDGQEHETELKIRRWM